jgi:hypothetical protein
VHGGAPAASPVALSLQIGPVRLLADDAADAVPVDDGIGGNAG